MEGLGFAPSVLLWLILVSCNFALLMYTCALKFVLTIFNATLSFSSVTVVTFSFYASFWPTYNVNGSLLFLCTWIVMRYYIAKFVHFSSIKLFCNENIMKTCI